jgi:hypothetical protein
MKICIAEFSVNTGILVIGSADPSAGPQPTLEQLPAATDAQIFMSCRQQIAPVRVELWRGEAPAEVRKLLSSEITLPAGHIAIGESFRRPCLSWPVCSPGETVEVRIEVDDEERSSHVIVTVNPTESQIPVLSDRDVLVRSLADLEDLDTVLAEHSFPMERLAASLRIVHRRARDGMSAARLRYAVQSVIEWMRWLRAGISAGDLANIEGIIISAVSSDSGSEQAAEVVFFRLADVLGISLEELLVARR